MCLVELKRRGGYDPQVASMMFNDPAVMASLGANSPSVGLKSMHWFLHSLDYLFNNPVNQWVEITVRSTVCFNPVWFTGHRVYELGIKASLKPF